MLTQADIDPDRLSFIRSLRVIRRQITDQAGFPPRRLAKALELARAEILERPNPRRRHRTSPRAVKRVHGHAYRKKQPTETTIHLPDSPNIKILAVS